MTNATRLEESAPAEGFVAACKRAGKEGWKLAALSLLFGSIGTVLTIWLPEFETRLIFKTPMDFSVAAHDGRLATLALTDVFLILGTLLIVQKPIRRQQYPFLYLTLTVIGIFCSLAISAHLSDGRSAKPPDPLIAVISWISVVTVLCATFVMQAARFGEDKILADYQPRSVSNSQADDYERRVGKV